MLIHQTVSVI